MSRRSGPLYRPPQDCAQSSTTFTLCLRAIFMMAPMSQTPPMTWVGAMATVRSGDERLDLRGGPCAAIRQRRRTPVWPRPGWRRWAVAMNPMAGQMTSVPGATPAATKAAWSAPVPELVPDRIGGAKDLAGRALEGLHATLVEDPSSSWQGMAPRPSLPPRPPRGLGRVPSWKTRSVGTRP